MTDKSLIDAIKSAIRAQIEYSTHFTQGAVTTQLIIVRAMLESGVIDKNSLQKEVTNALDGLTAEQKATAFPNALIQLANLLDLEAGLQQASAAEAWDEMTRLIDRISRQ
jgi:hypothetical protein